MPAAWLSLQGLQAGSRDQSLGSTFCTHGWGCSSHIPPVAKGHRPTLLPMVGSTDPLSHPCLGDVPSPSHPCLGTTPPPSHPCLGAAPLLSHPCLGATDPLPPMSGGCTSTLPPMPGGCTSTLPVTAVLQPMLSCCAKGLLSPTNMSQVHALVLYAALRTGSRPHKA